LRARCIVATALREDKNAPKLKTLRLDVCPAGMCGKQQVNLGGTTAIVMNTDGQQALYTVKTLAARVPPSVWISAAVVATTLVVGGLARAAAPPSSRLTGTAARAARELVATAVTLSTQAAQTGADARIRARDAAMGLAYVAAARILASDDVLQARTGVKIPELWATLRAQDTSLAR
jgi:hypothetical protein